MPKISLAIATYNEQDNIARCLNSVQGLVSEIVAVDGSSGDKTVDILKSFKAKVTVASNPLNFHINKNKAIDRCSGDWILQLDADEVVTPELKAEIKQAISDNFAAYYIPRKNFFLGAWLKKGGQHPDYVIRFFRRRLAHFPQRSVHEQLEVNGPVGYLKHSLLHYTAPDFSRYLTNANRYTSLAAQELANKKVALNLFNLLNYLAFKPALIFFSLYFRHKGFVDGMPGFIFAFFSGLHWPIAYLKYWEAHESRH